MPEPEQPQLYLITPTEFDPAIFCDTLSRVLDAQPIACLRLSLATSDEDRVRRAIDACRELTHARDVALVIDSHLSLVAPMGLDGVHLPDAAHSVRTARKTLGPDAIIGSFCGQSRHDGMTAGEAGADYIAFGPVGVTALGDGSRAGRDLFEWWSEMIELPVVAEGSLDEALVAELAPVTDFLAFGMELWRTPDPVSTLKRLMAAIG